MSLSPFYYFQSQFLTYLLNRPHIYLVTDIQDDSGEKDNIFGCDRIGFCEKKVHVKTCQI